MVGKKVGELSTRGGSQLGRQGSGLQNGVKGCLSGFESQGLGNGEGRRNQGLHRSRFPHFCYRSCVTISSPLNTLCLRVPRVRGGQGQLQQEEAGRACRAFGTH